MMITRFLQHLGNYNYSKNTISNYKICLTKFSKFCRDVGFYRIEESPEKISKQIIGMYVNHLLSVQSLDPRTVNMYLKAIRSFLKYLYIEEDRSVLDIKKIVLLKETVKPMSFLEKNDIEKLIECAKKEKEPLKRVRNCLIIKLLFTTGIRVSELTSIKVDDLSSEINIVGKGNKIRKIFIPDEIIKLAKYYVRRRKNKIKSEYLFVSHSKNSLGKRLSRNSIEFYMKKYGFYCGFTKKTNPHALRHSFATIIYRKGALSKDIQVLLGHSHLTTTEKYLRTNSEFSKKAAMMAR